MLGCKVGLLFEEKTHKVGVLQCVLLKYIACNVKKMCMITFGYLILLLVAFRRGQMQKMGVEYIRIDVTIYMCDVLGRVCCVRCGAKNPKWKRNKNHPDCPVGLLTILLLNEGPWLYLSLVRSPWILCCALISNTWQQKFLLFTYRY